MARSAATGRVAATRSASWSIPAVTHALLATQSGISFDSNGNTLDVYQPATGSGYPCVIYVHGGGWTSLDSTEVAATHARIAAKGFTVFSLNYRLAPGQHGQTLVSDVKAGILWAIAHAATYGGDASRVGVWGTSAGAHLVLMAVIQGALAGVAHPAVVSEASPSDLVDLVIGLANANSLVGFTYDGPGLVWDSLSPAKQMVASFPASLVVHDTGDPVVEYVNGTDLDAAMTAAGVVHTFTTTAFNLHGTNLLAKGVEAQVLNFMGKQLNPCLRKAAATRMAA